MDSQQSYFVGQLRSLVAPTPSCAAFPSSEETASHPDWLRAFTIFRFYSPLLFLAGQFVCWHAFLTSRRIDCQAADLAVGAGL